MFIKGSKEWIGDSAHTFLNVRSKIEQKLVSLGYDFFYGGTVSKRELYEKHFEILGADFHKILVEFSLNNNRYIFSPEYTFRVYEYLDRNKLFTENGVKVFYSQEMMRNEDEEDIQNGKTFSFWQIGYEIFGDNDVDLSIECIKTLAECISPLFSTELYYRITDKRIFNVLCDKYSIRDKERIVSLLEGCDENSKRFYQEYIKIGGDVNFAKELCYLLELSEEGKLTLEILEELLKENCAMEAIEDLRKVYRDIVRRFKNVRVKIVPVMPKTWEAYTTFICDARIDGYNRAIAGGGNLFINPSNKNCIHSGAGIGVTRIVEYLNKMLDRE